MKQRGPEIVAVIRQLVAERDGIPYIPEELPEKAPKRARAKPAKRGREAGDSAQKNTPGKGMDKRQPEVMWSPLCQSSCRGDYGCFPV
jgi:hypothetical protein